MEASTRRKSLAVCEFFGHAHFITGRDPPPVPLRLFRLTRGKKRATKKVPSDGGGRLTEFFIPGGNTTLLPNNRNLFPNIAGQ
jgi:hypothetical protein